MAADENHAMASADRHGPSREQSGLSGGLSTPQGFPSAGLGQAMVSRPVAMVGGRMVQVSCRPKPASQTHGLAVNKQKLLSVDSSLAFLGTDSSAVEHALNLA